MKAFQTFLVLSLVASSSTALAQPKQPKRPVPARPAPPPPPAPEPPPPPATPTLSESLSGDAKSAYESGKVLFGDGDHAGALVKFKSAYETSKDPRLLWNMAACEKNLRHYSKALTLVRQYRKDGEGRLSEDDKKEADELVKVMEPLTAKLRVVVNEPGAEVFVDDELVGTSPVEPIVVDIGMRKVRVRKADYEEVARELPVGGAAEVSAEIKLAKIVHEGRLVVKTSQDATIALDGRVVGTGSYAAVLPSGGHTLRITAPKMRPYQSEVIVQDNQARDLSITLDPEPSRGGVPAWMWIAGGVVVTGGLATAGYFVFRQDDKYEGPPGNLTPGIVQASRGFR